MTIHRAFGAEVLPGVEQRGIDLRRGEVHEARLMQHGEHGPQRRRRPLRNHARVVASPAS